jgi:hypothetical protein
MRRFALDLNKVFFILKLGRVKERVVVLLSERRLYHRLKNIKT